MESVRSADGTRIVCERDGHGPAVVIVNGGLADRSAGAALATLLESTFTVVRYDRRGRGDSGDGARYAVSREIEDLTAVVASTDGPAHVYGHSSGAVLALHAAGHGLPIGRLALYEPPFVASADAPRMPPGVTADLRDHLAAGDPEGAVTRFLIDSVGLPPEVVEQIRTRDPNFPRMVAMAGTLPYETTLVGDQEIPRSITGSVNVPTLVLCGGNSPDWVQHSARVLADQLADGRHATLEGQEHGAAPDALAPVLLDFLRGGG
jgi:pimeloyl-ACP methyl ester carboxylesterase